VTREASPLSYQTNAVDVKMLLFDDGVGDTFGSVCKTSGVIALISSNASDRTPIYSRQSASALRGDDAAVNNEDPEREDQHKGSRESVGC
jgi:hypothetical protein